MKIMIIQGKKVQLRPMTKEEIPMFYKWAAESDATPFWYDEFDEYLNHKISSFEKFRDDWKDYYFDDSQPKKGRCFIILVNRKAIGQVNYNKIINSEVEFDILIADKSNYGKGYGSDALKTLTKYLFEKMNVKKCWIEPTSKNPRAIKSYEKAGFKKIRTYVKEGVEWVRMKILNNKIKLNHQVKLIKITKEHFPLFYKWWNDPELAELTSGETKEYKKEKINRILNRNAKNKSRNDFMITVDEKPIGNVSLCKDKTQKYYKLYISIGEKEYWSKGYGTEAINQVIKWFYDKFPDEMSIDLEVNENNPRAQRCYEKCGFEFVKIKYRKDRSNLIVMRKCRYKNIKLEKEIEEIISKSPVKSDPQHSKSTREWVLKLEPDADYALQIAALAHDIERGFEKDYFRNDKSKTGNRENHSKQGAKIIKELLEKYNFNNLIINKIYDLVLKHELGGDEETNILMDADSISFFDNNLPTYFKDNGSEYTKQKIEIMFNRMSNKAKNIVKQFTYKIPELNLIIKEIYGA